MTEASHEKEGGTRRTGTSGHPADPNQLPLAEGAENTQGTIALHTLVCALARLAAREAAKAILQTQATNHSEGKAP
jgi:hypothetical protein